MIAHIFQDKSFQMGVLDPSRQDKETLMATLMSSVSESAISTYFDL